MADTKISALTDGNPAQSGDEIPIARSGANYKITAGSIASLASDIGAIRVLGPYTISYDTPDLLTGVEIYTPTEGEVLLDAWTSLITVWDGGWQGFIGDSGGKYTTGWASNTNFAPLLEEAVILLNPTGTNSVYSALTYSNYTTGVTQPVWTTTPGEAITDGSYNWYYAGELGIYGYAYGVWAANTDFSDGAIIYVPDPANPPNVGIFAWYPGYVGTTGGTEPTWDFTPAAFTADGDGYWSCLFVGTGPAFLDIGTFVGSYSGLWNSVYPNLKCTLTAPGDSQPSGVGVKFNTNSTSLSLVGASAYANKRTVPAIFDATNPLKVVVSSDGTTEGFDPGATQGLVDVYIVVGKPLAPV